MKKYLLLGGSIPSNNDRDVHYISSKRLCELYGVNPRDCYFIDSEEQLIGFNLDNLLILTPLIHGQYREFLEKYENLNWYRNLPQN